MKAILIVALSSVLMSAECCSTRQPAVKAESKKFIILGKSTNTNGISGMVSTSYELGLKDMNGNFSSFHASQSEFSMTNSGDTVDIVDNTIIKINGHAIQ